MQLADRSCDSIATFWQDNVVLAAGQIAYYLATGESGGIESGLDAATIPV